MLKHKKFFYYYVSYNLIFIGSMFFYKMNHSCYDALSPALMIEMGSLAIGISYDVNVSGLKSVSRGMGGPEIMIKYINPNPFGYKTRSQSRFF